MHSSTAQPSAARRRVETTEMGVSGGKERPSPPADFRARLEAAAAKYPLPEGVKFSYGTAGFRTVGEHLPGVAFRMGLFSAMHARKAGQHAGMMISASHNPAKDNGFKLVDGGCAGNPGGGMLPQSWEKPAERVANAGSPSELFQELQAVAEEFGAPMSGPATVHVGRDTRETGKSILAAFLKGVEVAGAQAIEHGVVITPQLHYFVWQSNVQPTKSIKEEDYLANAAESFRALSNGTDVLKVRLVVDCSNGVGAPQMAKLKARLEREKLFDPSVADIELRNKDISNAAGLNNLVGADFVQKERKAPLNFVAAEFAGTATHCAAFDGDADRLVYFYFNAQSEFGLLDGDRIIVLYAALIDRLLKQTEGLSGAKPRVGVVQTAYANGASTHYISHQLGLEIAFTATGVKHLHHKALEYDIGIYFEANGHGSVIFSDDFIARLKTASGSGATRLLALSRLANPVCGDAMCDMLLCEAALAELGWDIPTWASTYTDAPSRMTKVTVPDPQRIKTIPDQTRTTEPAGLQDKIDAVVKRYNDNLPSNATGSCRSFVRPSGTEPIVRVYAEATSQEDADKLAADIEDVVKEVLGGPRAA